MIEVGDRVRLKPDWRWLSQWYPLAETWRPGTVDAVEGDHCTITFDVRRKGAQPKTGDFAARDVILISKGPYEAPQQPALPGMTEAVNAVRQDEPGQSETRS